MFNQIGAVTMINLRSIPHLYTGYFLYFTVDISQASCNERSKCGRLVVQRLQG